MKNLYLLAFIFILFISYAFVSWGAEKKALQDRPTTISTTQDKCWKPSKTIHLAGKSCKEFINPQISCYVPTDVEGELKDPNLNSRQRAADLFSWQEFIALNWPASPGQRGGPDINKQITAKGPRVWETWKEAYEVYLPSGEKPLGWNEYGEQPEGCPQETSGKVLHRLQKINDVVDLRLQAAAATGDFPATLTDQKGNLVRYEIRMNKTLFDYIIQKGLYNGEQQAASDKVNFPNGSMLIKAAWREIGDEDKNDTGTFYKNTSCICESKDKNGEPTNCSTKKVGLVGLHIMHKTPSAPEWVWSTFEQVDNLVSTSGAEPSFYNPDCSVEQCPVNEQTHPPTPNQVIRVTKIPDKDPDCKMTHLTIDNIELMNREIRQSLTDIGSVLQYYQLIGTQWPLRNSKPSGNEVVDTVFEARPPILANSTMETFVQKSSSCMGCHSLSRTLKPDKFVSGDFSFTLNNARPHPQGAECTNISASESCFTGIIDPPDKSQTEWEKANWDKILKGHEITLNTYELYRPEFVSAKLHCGSCHLNAGGNPKAAWWVNMLKEYKTKKKLQDRINQCFERSMNGIHICNAENGECDSNLAMESLITYMEWLTSEWQKNNSAPSPRGFPKIAILEGNPVRGRATFKQKCSFCHNTDAKGRYEDGKYFRPALVGRNSFDACAGMAKPKTLAGFIKANMPYGSEGLLSDQEAWDIASFIDGECRPGKGKDHKGNICSKSRTCKNGKPLNE